MNDPLDWDELWIRARTSRPHGEPRSTGFATRLHASLRSEDSSFCDAIANWSLGFSCASIPLLVALAAVLYVQHGAGVPAGFDDLVWHWSEFLPSHH